MIKKSDIVVGARFRVKNGKAVRAFLAGTAPPTGGRLPFAVWEPGTEQNLAVCQDGEEFEIIPGPRRGGRPIYQYPEVSARFVSLKRIGEDEPLETYLINVLYDAELVKEGT